MSDLIFSDAALARRLEHAEARSNAAFVETRARLQPKSGAAWMETAGAYAMFDGIGSPLTQTFGLGMSGPPDDAHLATLEQFFQERGTDVFHEVSPLADAATLPLLRGRGYHLLEFTSVMFRPLRPGGEPDTSRNTRLQTRLARDDEHELWARTATEGWSEFIEYADFMLDLSRIVAGNEHTGSFFAELDGQPVATGALNIWAGVALLAGASTVPAARQQGAQLALLNARLSYAAEHGCDLAMMCALPGSASQRNAERQGFRIAYTRLKWQLG